ncbi:hypothetical protein [Alkalimonas amylolytica]|uniref:Uncharacterized protein n=1 Tax=Alkalimonas amylolytica TaxID=152573 RepID=A0A1H4B6G8_ALKAM|nr:hypothetical protein [Alkalimonas amylolytica]SEA43707.1 hypothetical protein SAMN04488051_103198 [Alkalimonas amylolytica]
MKKEIRYKNAFIEVSYNVITSKILVRFDGKAVTSKFIWLPFSNHKFRIGDEEFILKSWLFPLCKFKLQTSSVVLCEDLFPKLKRYSIVMLVTGPIKHIIILIAWVVS